MSSLQISTAPTWEPVEPSEAKRFAKIDTPDDDATVDRLRKAARERAELETGRTIPSTIYTWKLDRFPAGRGELLVPNPRLQTVDSIVYTDTDGVSQTLSSSLYQVDAHGEPGRIVPARNECWPDVLDQTLNAVTITFTAGYSAPAAVPDSLKIGILELFSHWYQNRDAERDIPLAVSRVFDAHWVGIYMYPDYPENN